MIIGILRHGELKYAEKELLKIGRKRGHQMKLINPLTTQLSIGIKPEIDILISRAEINSWEEPVMDAYCRVLDFYEFWNIPIINGKQATLNAQDKFRTHVLTNMVGIPTPKTEIKHNISNLRKRETNKFKEPYIIKKVYGGRGEGVYLINNELDLKRIEEFFSQEEPFIIQEYLNLEKNKQGGFKDMRLWVCRNEFTEKPEFVGGFYRNSNKNNFRTNLCTGGWITKIKKINPKISKIAEKSLEAINADVAGIDVAISQEGKIYLIEINISFDSTEEMRKIVGCSIEEKILNLAENRVKKIKIIEQSPAVFNQ